MTRRFAIAGHLARLVAIVLPIVGIAACSSKEAVRPPPCPRVAILSDASTMTRFAAGTGRDLTDVNYQAEVTDIRAGCRYDFKEKQAPVIVVALAPVIVATRGPANRDRQARFDYFVTVVGRDRTILNKQAFDISVEFEGNRSRITRVEDEPPITIDIPLAGGRTAYDFEILVGLQLTQEELEYNLQSR